MRFTLSEMTEVEARLGEVAFSLAIQCASRGLQHVAEIAWSESRQSHV
jgi:hypothetical protein